MNFKDIKKLINLAIKTDLAEIEYTEGETKVRIVRGKSPQIQIPISPHTLLQGQVAQQHLPGTPGITPGPTGEKVVETPPKEEHYEQITSPMVGTFYRASAPDADPYVDIGTIVDSEHTVCIIEAMKLMNEIKTEFKCKIIEILVENGHSVEFGQPMFKVQKL